MATYSICATVLVALLLPAKSSFLGEECSANDRAGTCLTVEQCQPLWEEVKRAGRPMPMHIRRKLHELHCGFSDAAPLVCCIGPNDNGDSGGGNTGTIDPFTSNPLTGTETRSGEPPNVQNHRNLRLLPNDICGVVDTDRIMGGNKVAMYELPWMALLSYSSARGETKLSCGGALISERYVLTAAHCVSFLKTMRLTAVRLGENDVTKDPDCERGEDEPNCAPNVKIASIEEVIPHKGYSPQTLVDDIALIRLTEPADFSLSSIKPVCLPVTPELQTQYMEGMPARVAGWGATELGVQSTVLLSVELPIVGNKECYKAYNGSPPIYDRQLCAGGVVDQDSCSGDSGGPLTFPGNFASKGERVVQRGIVSYGSRRCGIGGLPGVYTRVAFYMDWILDNIRG